MTTTGPTGPAGAAAGTRWGLVLGGGGVLGAAWMAGALAALERTHGLDARTADVIMGTSAGSVMAAMLGAGVSVAELCDRQLGRPVTTGPFADLVWADEPTGSAHPPLPRMRPGNAGLVLAQGRRLRQVPPTALLAGFAPEGRGSLAAIGDLVAAVNGPGWSRNPAVRVVALDYETGRRVTFGAPGAPTRTWRTPSGRPAPSPAGTRRCRSTATGTSTAGPGRRPTSTCCWTTGWTGSS